MCRNMPPYEGMHICQPFGHTCADTCFYMKEYLCSSFGPNMCRHTCVSCTAHTCASTCLCTEGCICLPFGPYLHRHMPLYEGMHICQPFWPYLRRYMPLNERILMFAVWAKHVQTHVCQLYWPYTCKHVPLCRGMHVFSLLGHTGTDTCRQQKPIIISEYEQKRTKTNSRIHLALLQQ